jgi:hypothetical protein
MGAGLIVTRLSGMNWSYVVKLIVFIPGLYVRKPGRTSDCYYVDAYAPTRLYVGFRPRQSLGCSFRVLGFGLGFEIIRNCR